MKNRNNTADTLGKKVYTAPSLQDNEISATELMVVKSNPKDNIIVEDPWEDEEEIEW